MVNLRKMTDQEFINFKKYSIADYAKDLMQERSISRKESELEAEKEFNEMLEYGVDTKDHALKIIEDRSGSKTLGFIWFLYEETDGVKHTFLNDFLINEEERRKGYAMSALIEMEREAKLNGCTECRLYVWKHNLSGLNLYKKSGYTTFRELGDGMYMRKEI